MGVVEGKSSISHSYATGEVFGNSNNVGGLVGKMEMSSIINSYAAGRVFGTMSVGGLVGNIVGGIPHLSNSYAVGEVESTDMSSGGGRRCDM